MPVHTGIISYKSGGLGGMVHRDTAPSVKEPFGVLLSVYQSPRWCVLRTLQVF